MLRLVFLTFFGECRADEETNTTCTSRRASMTFPLVVLGILSVVGGWVGLPSHWAWGNRFEHFLEPVVGHHAVHALRAAWSTG